MKYSFKSLLSFVLLVTLTTSQGISQYADWLTFESPQKDYSVLFPDDPSPYHQSVDSEIGELKLYIYMYESTDPGMEDNLVYGVIGTEYPELLFSDATEETISEFFRNSVDGAVANVDGELLAETDIKLEGYPGREVKVDISNGMAILLMRMYLVDNKMYMLQTITDASKDDNASIDHFMDSFQLIN